MTEFPYGELTVVQSEYFLALRDSGHVVKEVFKRAIQTVDRLG